MTSIKTMSGCCCSKRATASRPFSATHTVYPSFCSIALKTIRLVRSSSAIRMVNGGAWATGRGVRTDALAICGSASCLVELEELMEIGDAENLFDFWSTVHDLDLGPISPGMLTQEEQHAERRAVHRFCPPQINDALPGPRWGP